MVNISFAASQLLGVPLISTMRHTAKSHQCPLERAYLPIMMAEDYSNIPGL